ncbi:SafA/ExsA family spore coat assembly protein [Neobacillus sp. NPDC093127]|uniref:SafA/ExsA family spore coat assembly protein n=1 Tax=Neobacillus sp. NPDC093127 TaxID=3364296 RepID=UPI0038230A2A
MKIHIVQKGDTLWKIAKKYGVNFEELKKMNSQLSNPDMIMPGMKIKVPTAGGTVKKEGPIHIGKKEVPIAEHPFAKEKPKEMPIKEMPIKEMPIKEMPIKEIPKKEIPIKEIPKKEIPIKAVPIKEVPIKEAPILKEAPKAPYTPKMPLKVVPEKDINNYYMSNMTNMTPNLPPNILPEVKEVPIPVPMPVQEACVQDYCVPVTPVMPGPGFCPPFGGYPMQPMPYPQVQGAAYAPTPNYPGMVQGNPGAAPFTAGAPVMAGQYYQDESSSFMPQMPIMNPAYNPGAVMGAQNPGVQTPFMAPGSYGQMPTGYGEMPGSYGQMPTGYGEMPGAYGQMPAGCGEMPGAYGQMPAGYGGTPGAYGQMPAAGYGGTPEPYGQMPAGYGGTPGAYGQMPAGYVGTPGAYGQMPAGYGEMPGAYGQMPAGYGGTPGAYGQMPAGYGGTPGAYGQMPAGYGEMPGAYGQMPPSGYGGMPEALGQMPAGQTPPGRNGNPYGMGTPYGYPQMSGSEPQVPDFEASQGAATAVSAQAPYMQAQSLPVGAGGDCGCGGPGPSMDKMQPAGARPNELPVNFVPPTPPIYSAPYTGPVNAAQPPYMNPYGMSPAGTNYGMPGYRDESD